MFELREYQKEAVQNALEYFNNKREKHPVIEVLPTGAGKSLVIANIAKELNEPTLVFQPSKEILEQNYSKLVSYGIMDCSIYSASFNSKDISNLTFATIGSVKSNPENFRHFKNIIVDECHYVNSKGGMYKEFFNVIGEKIIGLTATPYRLASNSFGSELRFLTRTRPKIFHKVIYNVQTSYLFAKGYLSPLKYYQISGFDSSRLKPNSTGADYTDASVRRHYQEIQFPAKIEAVVQRLLQIKRKNILVFTRFVEEAKNLVSKFDGAEIVSSDMKMSERNRVINGFKSGDIKIVANVGVLTHGFDYPELETVVTARPTRSLALYYQMIGRGIRPHKDKPFSMIIDMCENYERFGRIEDLRLVEPKNNLWHYETKGRRLTNVYYD